MNDKYQKGGNIQLLIWKLRARDRKEKIKKILNGI